MSNLAEIKRIEEQMAGLQKQINALKSSALTVEIPAVKFELLPGEAEDLTWDQAVAWAKEQGGELPTRQEMLALYTNLKDQFKPEWYWTGEQLSGDPDYAWMQDFDFGGQYDDRKSGRLRARAVRRSVI